MTLPAHGQTIEIQSYKHDGSLHRTWKETLVLEANETTLIGGNNETLVIEADGSYWRTKEPAIVYFHTKKWFNIVAIFKQGEIHYYCNIGSPAVWNGTALTYTDYDLDIIVEPDGEYHLVDQDEYEERQVQMNYPEDVKHHVDEGVQELKDWIKLNKSLFDKTTVRDWMRLYKKLLAE